MPESFRPVRELLEAAAAFRKSSKLPVLSLGGGAAVPSENRSGATTDQQMLRLWLDSKRSKHTRRAYAQDLKVFNDFLAALPPQSAEGGRRPDKLHEITVMHIEAFLRHMERHKVPPRTQARRLSSIKSLLTFAQQTGYLHFNVGSVVKLPPFPDGIAERILSESEVHACIYAAPKGRDRAVLRFLYSTGCRNEELRRVRWEHLHYREARMAVQLFGKGGRTRYVAVPLDLRTELEGLRRANMSGFVFESCGGKQLGEKDVWRIVQRAARRAGITRQISPHCFRHSHASHALSRGADIQVVQKTLGHTSIRTTGDYLHIERGDSSAMYLDPSALGDVE